MMSKRQEVAMAVQPAAARAKRRWTAKQSWDNIKEYVVSAVNAGTPQKTILANLKAQGVTIERHQLQRLLKDWGLADKNLLQRHRKYIYETERTKTIKEWRFKDSNRPVKATQLERIRESDGKEFEGVVSSPGMLVYSPMNTTDIRDDELADSVSSPTLGEMSEEAWEIMDVDNKGEYRHGFDQSDIDDTDQSETKSDHDPWDESNPSSPISQDTGITMISAEDLEIVSGDYLESPICDDSQVPMILERIFTGFAISIEDLPKERDIEAEPETLSGVTPQSFGDYISPRFRRDLDDYIAPLRRRAERYLRDFEDFKRTTKYSLHKCEILARNTREFRENLDDGYAFDCRSAHAITIDSPRNQKTALDQDFEDTILSIYDSYISKLWCFVGADNATFAACDGPLVADWSSTELFRSLAVHLPYLIEKYGIRHYFTMQSVYALGFLCDQYTRTDSRVQIWSQALETLNQDKVSPLSATLFNNIIDRMVIGRTPIHSPTQTSAIARAAFTVTRKFYGVGSMRTIFSAANLMYLLSFLGSSADTAIQELSDYISRGVAQLRLTRGTDFNILHDILTIMLSQKSLGQLKEAANTNKLMCNIFDGLVAEGAELTYQRRSYYRGMQCYRGLIFYEQKDYVQALQAIQTGFDRFTGMPMDATGEALVDAATQVMTARGLVRYTEPILERLIRIYETKNKSQEDPLYRKLLFAAGSAAFQLYIDEDQWNVEMVGMIE